MSEDCSQFNLDRVGQLMDCATPEEKRCLMKLFAYRVVIDAGKTVLKKKIKLESEEGASALAEEVLNIVLGLADQASMEMNGHHIFKPVEGA